PNGRFETHRKICLSISGYHPESWRPSWSIRTALLAIIGFMPTHGAGAIGSLDLPKEERRALARSSLSYVCDTCGSAQNLLRPLTDASRSVNKEAMEAASQISMMGDGSGDGNKEEAIPSSSASMPESDQMTAPLTPATLSKPAAATTLLPPPREAETTTSACS
ncbi:ubiquitin-conjugating enzyme E2 J1, partial [Paragonimus westermani]